MTLRIKLLSLFSIIIIASHMLNISIYNHFLKKNQEEQKNKDMQRIVSLFQRDIETTMLTGKPEAINSIIGDYSTMDNILSLRILDEKGIILKSMRTVEVGLMSADYIQQKKMFQDRLYYLKPIESSPPCQSCHGDRKILGIIEIKYDLSEIIIAMERLKRIWAISGILVFLTALILTSVIVNRLLLDPLKKILFMLNDPDLMEHTTKERDDEMEELSVKVKDLIHKFKNLMILKRNLQEEISELRAEMRYKEKLEEMNRELRYSLKELESTNKALHLLSQETKKRLNLMEINIGRLKRTGDITVSLCERREMEEITKSFIKYIVDIISAERGIIYIRKNSSDFTYNYIRNYGFNPEISGEDKDLLFRILKNGLPILDIHPASGRQVIVIPVSLKESLIGGVMVEGVPGETFSHHDVEMMTVFSNHLSGIFKNIQSFERVTKGYTYVVETLIGDVLEENRFYRKGRSKRLKILSVELGKRLGLLSKDLEILEQASALSDIGKLRIPYRIFNKKGPLTSEEFDILRMHPIKGAELFDGMLFHDLKKVILQHHERYDGKGYPEGIEGEDIDIKARIISLVDAFEAMTSDRPYRPALTLEETLKEIEKQTGGQFDPEVVRKFFDIIKENPQLLVDIG